MYNENGLIFFNDAIKTCRLPFPLTAIPFAAIAEHRSVDGVLLLAVFMAPSAMGAAATMTYITAQLVWMHGCVWKIPRHWNTAFCVTNLSTANAGTIFPFCAVLVVH